MIVDPHGEVMTSAGDTNDEVITAEIDPALVGRLRTQWGYFRERRPDLYGKRRVAPGRVPNRARRFPAAQELSLG